MYIENIWIKNTAKSTRANFPNSFPLLSLSIIEQIACDLDDVSLDAV